MDTVTVDALCDYLESKLEPLPRPCYLPCAKVPGWLGEHGRVLLRLNVCALVLFLELLAERLPGEPELTRGPVMALCYRLRTGARLTDQPEYAEQPEAPAQEIHWLSLLRVVARVGLYDLLERCCFLDEPEAMARAMLHSDALELLPKLRSDWPTVLLHAVQECEPERLEHVLRLCAWTPKAVRSMALARTVASYRNWLHFLPRLSAKLLPRFDHTFKGSPRRASEALEHWPGAFVSPGWLAAKGAWSTLRKLLECQPDLARKELMCESPDRAALAKCVLYPSNLRYLQEGRLSLRGVRLDVCAEVRYVLGVRPAAPLLSSLHFTPAFDLEVSALEPSALETHKQFALRDETLDFPEYEWALSRGFQLTLNPHFGLEPVNVRAQALLGCVEGKCNHCRQNKQGLVRLLDDTLRSARCADEVACLLGVELPGDVGERAALVRVRRKRKRSE